MKDRTILILLICIMAVGSFIGIQEYWRYKSQSRAFEQKKLFDLDLNSLTSIQFKSSESVIECAKENGVWLVGDRTQGMGRADVAVVYRMVAVFNQFGKGTTITVKELELRGLNASEYGLEPPSKQIIAVDNQGRHTWMVGRATPLGDEVYVKKSDGEEIYTVSSKLLSVIPTDPDQLRNRMLFPGAAAAVKRLEIRGPGGFIRVMKELSSEWRIQQPIVAQADPQEVDAYINSLYMLRIDDFIADNVSDLSVYGLQGETRQISVGTSDGSATTLVLGDDIPGRTGFVYARRADDTSVFALQDDVLQLLGVSANRFRNARILALPKEEISSVTIQRENAKLVLEEEQESGKWKVASPVIWDANIGAVASLIDLWSHAVVTEFDVSTNSLASEWVLEFASTGSGVTNRIEVLPAGDRKDGLLVRLNREPSVFQINLPFVPDSIIDPLVYKNKRIWTLTKSEIKKLILHKSGQQDQSVERSEDGIFVPTLAHGNSKADTVAVTRMIDRLCNISTSEYIAYNPRNLEVYGLCNPSVELFVGLVDSNELGRVLLIGRESTDGYYSMVKGRDLVFYLDKETVQSISSDLVVRPKVPNQVSE